MLAGRSARAPRPSRRRRRPSRPARGDRLGDARVPAANGSSSNAPIGPFQKTDPAPGDLAGVALGARGADVEAHPAVGTSTPSSTRCSASAARRSPITRSIGSCTLARPGSVALRERAARVLDVLLAAQRVADRVPLRAQEREAHRAADDHHVGELEEAVDHGDLVRHLGAADRPPRAGAAGCSRIAVERLHLALQQPPGGARQQVRNALGARVRAVRGAERVVDVRRRRARPAPREARDRCSSRPARSARSRAPAPRPARAARRAP